MEIPVFIRRPGATLLAILAAVAAFGAGCRATKQAPSTTTILVDNIHSNKQPETLGMAWNDYRYNAMHGEKRLFDFLEANGYPHRHVTRADAVKLTPAVLEKSDILLVDLIGQYCLDYAPDEIEAVRQFVDRGGSLLVIADHTNVYDHARRSNALLEPFGTRILYSAAVERPPSQILDEIYWVAVRSFADHPTTRGVQTIFLATGAPLATEHGVAFLSEHGFADFWNLQSQDPSFIGNGKFDNGEESGRLPMIAAGEYGRGRFAVLGDENLLGNSRMFLSDNFELVANVFEWLGHRESETPPLRSRMQATLRVAFDAGHGQWNIAGNACDGYLPFYTDFNRGAGVVARGVLHLGGSWDVLVFTDPEVPLDAIDLARVRSHLEAGGTTILMTDVVRAQPGSIQLLRDLVPQVMVNGKQRFGLDALPARDLVATATAKEAFPLVSASLDVTGLRIAGHEYPSGTRCGMDIEKSHPYLRQLTATGGEPLLQARVGDGLVDIARLYPVGKGRLIVFFQDGPFRNETLGWERQPATPYNEDSHRFVHQLVGWLRQLHARTEPALASEPLTRR